MVRPDEPLIVGATLELLPPMVRRSLIRDRAFLDRWNLVTTVWVTLGGDGPSFNRAHLFEAFREAMRTPLKGVEVKDQEGKLWSAFARPKEGVLTFSLEDENRKYPVSDHSMLSDSAEVRLAWFERAATTANLQGNVFEKWRTRLKEAPLEDADFGKLNEDLSLTPISVIRVLKASMERGSADLTTMVPLERRYYERLVGKTGDQGDVTSYIELGVRPLVERLLDLRTRTGLLLSLLLCSAGYLSAIVDLNCLPSDEVQKAFEWLAAEGDLNSKVAAIEVGLAHLDSHPQLEPIVERLVLGIINEDPDDDGGQFALLSALIVVVGGELARTRVLDGAPPFWSRQATIAHASLICRALISSPQIDPKGVTEWSKMCGLGYLFYLRALIDLRLEPRWLPDFVDGAQLKADFLGRIANAANSYESRIKADSLRKLLLAKDGALVSGMNWPFPFLPGPMEGSSTPLQAIPPEILKQVSIALSAEQLEPNSFAGLVNTVLLYELPSDQSSLAAAALRRVKYSIENAFEEARIFGLISGLAIVAAVTRSADLADELRVLTRVMRRRERIGVDPDEELRIAMIAAASRSDLDEWARCTGEWITEIAFELADRRKASKVLAKVRRLVEFEPALARHCAVADAALSGFAE
jgi:hypothetical protein